MRRRLTKALDKFTIKTINPTTTATQENQDLNLETQSSSGVSTNSTIENKSKESNKIDSEKIDFNDPATWPK